jgi:hypothetical protein
MYYYRLIVRKIYSNLGVYVVHGVALGNYLSRKRDEILSALALTEGKMFTICFAFTLEKNSNFPQTYPAIDSKDISFRR